MKKSIQFLTLLCIIVVFLLGSCRANHSKSGQRAVEKQAQTQAIAKVVAVNKSTKIVLIKEIAKSTNNTTGEKLYKVRTIPSDSITHFATVSRLYEVNDTLRLSDAIMFK